MRTIFSQGARTTAGRTAIGRLGGPAALTLILLLSIGVGQAAPAHPAATAGPSEGWYHLTAHGVVPVMRDQGALAFDAHDGYALLFGGCRAKVCPMADTWRYEGGIWTNLTASLSVVPVPRTGASLVYDAHDGYLLLFGGSSGSLVFNDTWSFVNGLWSPVATHGATPPGRTGAAMAYDVATQSTILFGGAGAGGVALADTWSYSGGVWTDLSASLAVSPPARSAAASAYDAADAVMVVFGGTGLCGTYCSDTWTFDGGRWWNDTSASTAPSGRYGAAVAYDAGRQSVFLFGGTNAAVLGDSWSFSHSAWTYLGGNSSSSPGTRFYASAAFDGTDGYLILFGGHPVTSAKSGTWAFLDPLVIGLAAQSAATNPGAADSFTSAPAGGLGPYNVSWNFGDGSAWVVGLSAGHTFQALGSFVVTATVSDSLGYSASAALTVVVSPTPLKVAISLAPASPRAGQTVTMTATASGGVGPYSYQWSGDVSGCSAASGAVLSCVAGAAGSFQISVTVSDAQGRTASAAQTVTVAAASGGLTSAGPPSPAAAASGLSSQFTSFYFASALVVACAVGVATYRVGRRREAARKQALRPLCYAVPAWSETPAEFEPDALPPSPPWQSP